MCIYFNSIPLCRLYMLMCVFMTYLLWSYFTGLGFGRSADNISTFVDEVFAGSLVSTVICHQCHTVRVHVLCVCPYVSMS